MNDEKYVFVSDVRERKSIARSARYKRTHRGKGGSVKFPSDNLTKKELKALSGEVKEYRMNDPLTWSEFKDLPDDLKITYIKSLREKFGVHDSDIADMFGVHRTTLSNYFRTLGVSTGRHKDPDKQQLKAWYDWVGGVPTEPVGETKEVAEKVLAGFEDAIVPAHEYRRLCGFGEKIIPDSGTLTLEGRVEDTLNTVAALLGGANVRITVSWEVFREDGVCIE